MCARHDVTSVHNADATLNENTSSSNVDKDSSEASGSGDQTVLECKLCQCAFLYLAWLEGKVQCMSC